MFEVNRNPSRAELRKFALVIMIGLGVIGGLLWWLGAPDEGKIGLSAGRMLAIGLWTLGAVAGLATLAHATVGRYIYVGWMSVAVAIGMVVTPVLFTVLYFLILPIFTLVRLTDPLHVKIGRQETYWEVPKPYEPTLERMRRPF